MNSGSPMFGTLLAVVAILVALASLWAVSDAGRKIEEHNKSLVKNQMAGLVKQITELKRVNDDLLKRVISAEERAAGAEGIRQEFTQSNEQLTRALKALHREITIIEKAIPPRKLEALRGQVAKSEENHSETVS